MDDQTTTPLPPCSARRSGPTGPELGADQAVEATAYGTPFVAVGMRTPLVKRASSSRMMLTSSNVASNPPAQNFGTAVHSQEASQTVDSTLTLSRNGRRVSSDRTKPLLSVVVSPDTSDSTSGDLTVRTSTSCAAARRTDTRVDQVTSSGISASALRRYVVRPANSASNCPPKTTSSHRALLHVPNAPSLPASRLEVFNIADDSNTAVASGTPKFGPPSASASPSASRASAFYHSEGSEASSDTSSPSWGSPSFDMEFSPMPSSIFSVPSDRRRGPEAASPRGIQPHMARSSAPVGWANPVVDDHPWARYLVPRSRYRDLCSSFVTSRLPSHVYQPLGLGGYFRSRFTRSLFPRRFVGTPSESLPLPIVELMSIRDAIALRCQADDLISRLREGLYHDSDPQLPATPLGRPLTRLYPPMRDGCLPALYQVVSINYGLDVILEAKDFLIPGPDHQELQCIVLDQCSINVLSNTRGFDRSQLSVKDFVWVQSIKPTRAALENPEKTLALSQIPRVSAKDTRNPFFFRVNEFILVPPPSTNETVLGLVVALRRHGPNQERIGNVSIAVEGCTDAISIMPRLCKFNVAQTKLDEFMCAETRANVSTAMRFSELPASSEAQQFLTNAVRRFLPAHPEASILPLRVFRPPVADREWIRDRAEGFFNYSKDKKVARQRMGRLFNVACAALSAATHIGDDRSTHRLTAVVKNLQAHPVCLHLEVHRLSSETGWKPQRPADVWIVDSNTVAQMVVHKAEFDYGTRITYVELRSTVSCHLSLARAVERFCRRRSETEHELDICVRLGNLPSGADPVFTLLAEHKIFAKLDKDDQPRRAHQILDAVYDRRVHLSWSIPALPPPPPSMSITLGPRQLSLRDDQIRAIQMGTSDIPLLVIQAPFGAGKTVVGAVIAAKLAEADRDQLIIVTTTTNSAVAHFTDTLLSLSDFHHFPLLRFVADSALRDGAPVTSADLHTVLRGLDSSCRDQLLPEEVDMLRSYARGRKLVEETIFRPGCEHEFSEEERERYRIAERENSDATEKAVSIMFRVRRPRILCMTMTSLLNSTRSGGIFSKYLTETRVIICDEASQVPEPAFVAVTSWFPNARMIVIGDSHQLQPHIRCLRSSAAAEYGARGTMDLLLSKDIPVAPMITTFRAHPALNDLPNFLFYGDQLVSGATANQRQLLVNHIRLPNPQVPFLFLNVQGRSKQSDGGSHSNVLEAKHCKDIVEVLLAKGVPPPSIAIITFYKDQLRLLKEFATSTGVAIHTVDSTQGREFDIVLLLTTRTHIVDEETCDFLEDRYRVNVGLTLCRHGQIVLGRAKDLIDLENWSGVICWAKDHGVFVEDQSSLSDILA